MPTIEERQIGLGLELEQGTFDKVVYVDGQLQLVKNEENELYEFEGYWESEVIDLEHRFKEFKKVALTSDTPSGAQIGIEVRTSDDGVSFGEYTQTAVDGTFQLPPKRYIQVKINLYAGFTAQSDIIDFKSTDSLKKLFESFWFQSDEQGLGLKEGTVAIPMELDEEYTGEGYVYVAELDKDEFITETITKLDIL